MIEIRALRKTYADGHQALNGIDLDIHDGMLGLLGPNGAGKTTFLSALTMILEPTSGSRIYDGLDASRASNRSAIRRMIGYLPQDFTPIRHLSGFDYLVYCAQLRGLKLSIHRIRERAHQLLDAVFLQEAAFRRSGEYSGGMRRRLGIAQALIHSPRLVVVDEPTAGLDPEERIRFRNLIADVAEDRAVLLSTHIVEDIEATCPRIVVIGRGEILFDGEPAELLRRASGKLWDIESGSDLPSGARIISERAEEGRRLTLVLSEAPVPGGVLRDVTLEEAYSAFLAGQGVSRDEQA
ncbi:MAG TPA: ATP-binding cassette domain-containing protein [Thermoanaerobaculia bacterium]|nr:ATP-binding cassette domain-containing protein [Thermoanaerobaculia bacterium]